MDNAFNRQSGGVGSPAAMVAAGATAAVPEPAMAGLLATAGAASLLGRRRRRA